MSGIKLNTAWKEKVEPNNFFDDKFLNEKDKALQPLSELFEASNDLPSNTDKTPLKKISEEKNKKKSLKESDLYDSNIVIIQTVSENDSELTAMNQIEKEVEKINKIILKKKLKKSKKKSKSKSKKIES